MALYPLGAAPVPTASPGTFDATMPSAPANELKNYGNGVAGWSNTIRTELPHFKLGQTAVGGPNNNAWIYVKASAAIGAGATVAAPVAVAVNTGTGIASAGAGFFVEAPFAANEHGWARKGAGLL